MSQGQQTIGTAPHLARAVTNKPHRFCTHFVTLQRPEPRVQRGPWVAALDLQALWSKHSVMPKLACILLLTLKPA